MRFLDGEFEFDPGSLELRWRGEPVRVQKRTLGVIRHLLEHADRVVPTEELRRHVWKEVTVGDDAIRQAVAQARRTLKDTHGSFLVTVRGYGYRLRVSRRPGFSCGTDSCGPMPPEMALPPESLACLHRGLAQVLSRKAAVCVLGQCEDTALLADYSARVAREAGLGVVVLKRHHILEPTNLAPIAPCAPKPAGTIVDGLEVASPRSLRWLRELIESVASLSVLIVITYSRSAFDAKPELADAFAKMMESARARTDTVLHAS